MGRKVLGSAAARLASSAAFFWGSAALAQPAPEPVVLEEAPSASPPPAAQPAPPAPSAAPAPAPAPSASPPLFPPPPNEPAQRPGFLRTREELEALKPGTPSRLRLPNPDFVARSSPWVDFSFTSFYMKDRVGNFLNFGAQVGGYFFQHLRLSARIVAPTENVQDEQDGDSIFSSGGSGNSFRVTSKSPSRSMSVLYGASVGLVVSNDRSFVFGPNIGFVRTDVEDYGTAVVVGLPFEWTTSRNLRVGFELSIGHAGGGTSRSSCITNSSGLTTSCGVTSADRQGGTAVVFSYYMGWSLGRL